jgi:hypothetical protein
MVKDRMSVCVEGGGNRVRKLFLRTVKYILSPRERKFFVSLKLCACDDAMMPGKKWRLVCCLPFVRGGSKGTFFEGVFTRILHATGPRIDMSMRLIFFTDI